MDWDRGQADLRAGERFHLSRATLQVETAGDHGSQEFTW